MGLWRTILRCATRCKSPTRSPPRTSKASRHRDLKPANILVTASGIKLLDFGLGAAKLQRRQRPARGGGRYGHHWSDTGGNHSRHRRVHVARAGRRQSGRCPLGYFLFRIGALRNVERAARLSQEIRRSRSWRRSCTRNRRPCRRRRLCKKSWLSACGNCRRSAFSRWCK